MDHLSHIVKDIPRYSMDCFDSLSPDPQGNWMGTNDVLKALDALLPQDAQDAVVQAGKVAEDLLAWEGLVRNTDACYIADDAKRHGVTVQTLAALVAAQAVEIARLKGRPSR